MRLNSLLGALRAPRTSTSSAPHIRPFTTTLVVGRGLAPRQRPVLEAFCKYLEGRDLSGFSHRSAVFMDFMQQASPEIQKLGVYVRAPSDLFYLYADELSVRCPDFWNMRRTPVTRQQPKRKNVAHPQLQVDRDILKAYLAFLRAFDWRRPVSRAILRLEFTQSLPPGPMLTRVKGAVSFWKNFERIHCHVLESVPQWAHLHNTRSLHIVDMQGIVRRLGPAEQKKLGGERIHEGA
ncbi:unnamed protein product [Cutaneotrichosporon oleaginosum]